MVWLFVGLAALAVLALGTAGAIILVKKLEVDENED
jgi:hypothetical protein